MNKDMPPRLTFHAFGKGPHTEVLSIKMKCINMIDQNFN